MLNYILVIYGSRSRKSTAQSLPYNSLEHLLYFLFIKFVLVCVSFGEIQCWSLLRWQLKYFLSSFFFFPHENNQLTKVTDLVKKKACFFMQLFFKFFFMQLDSHSVQRDYFRYYMQVNVALDVNIILFIL